MSVTTGQLPKMALRAIFKFKLDKTKAGWSLEKNAEFGSEDQMLGLKNFLEEGESKIQGYEVLKRAEKIGDLAGQLHAERLIYLQEDIPEEWKAFCILFMGTVWHNIRGQCIPIMRWDGKDWHVDFDNLYNDFDCKWRIARLYSPVTV